jgi:XTP/dITP diphosphohydrolase
VLAGQPISLEDQLAEWEERKAAEKSRNSLMDDVHTGQPALALAQKVIQRAEKAGLPADLIPAEITAVSVSADIDAESGLRASVLEFVDTVRTVEGAIAAARRGDNILEALDVAPVGEITEEEWRAHWPDGDSVADAEPAADETATGAAAPDDNDEDAGESDADDQSGAASKASGGGSKRRRGRK